MGAKFRGNIKGMKREAKKVEVVFDNTIMDYVKVCLGEECIGFMKENKYENYLYILSCFWKKKEEYG